MKFKSDIEIQAGVEAGGSTGSNGQVLSSTGSGVAWIDPSTIVAEAATLVVIACKNTSGAVIAQGTPVYQTGTVGATATIEIAPADALISENKLPAIGLLQTDLNNNGFGNVVITGELTNFTTSPIDGVVPTTGDKVFVKSGGGLTLTKPTGEGNGIQNMGLVGKVSGGNAGSITVSSIMRTNDVPNLPEGRIWVGDGNTIVSDTVYIDEPNNRIGIGTTSPAAKLEVKTPSYNAGNAVTNFVNGNNPVRVSYDTVVIAQTDVPTLSIVETIDGSQANEQKLTFSVGDNKAVIASTSTTTDGMYFNVNRDTDAPAYNTGNGITALNIKNNGNVGIGTTSPVSLLHIKGADPVFTIQDTSTGTAQASSTLRLGESGSGGVLDVYWDIKQASDDLNTHLEINHSSNGNHLTILDNGNVGIGTTSPDFKLDTRIARASGAFLTDGQVYALGLQNTDTTAGNATAMTFGHGGYEYTNFIASVRTGTGANPKGDLVFGGRPSDGANFSESMRILANGNVGIGTTSPQQKLHIVDTDGANIILNSNTGAENNGIWMTEGGIASPYANGAYVHYDSTNNAFKINTGTTSLTTKLTIERDSGNVGIGTTSPTQKLHVSNGKVLVDVTSSVGTELILQNLAVDQFAADKNYHEINFITSSTSSETTGGYVRIKAGQEVSGNDNRSYLGFWTAPDDGAVSEKMRITSSGNVGIGTASPGYKLHVDDNTAYGGIFIEGDNAPGLTIRDNSGTSESKIYVQSTSGSQGNLRISSDNNNTATTPTIEFLIGNSHKMRILDNGNVGIGTTSPSEKLDVVGNIELNGALYISSSGIYQQQNSDVSGLELVANVSLSFYRAAFFDYVIQKAGNVRAGTVFACNDGVSVEYTETSTNDIGDTSDVVLSVDISAGNMRLLADAATSGWSVKSLIRAI